MERVLLLLLLLLLPTYHWNSLQPLTMGYSRWLMAVAVDHISCCYCW